MNVPRGRSRLLKEMFGFFGQQGVSLNQKIRSLIESFLTKLTFISQTKMLVTHAACLPSVQTVSGFQSNRMMKLINDWVKLNT